MNFLHTVAKQRIVTAHVSLYMRLANRYTDFYQADAPFDWYQTY